VYIRWRGSALQLMRVNSARELAEIIVSVGLAQNLAAIRALATEGIQTRPHGVARAASRDCGGRAGRRSRSRRAALVAEKQIRAERARVILSEMRAGGRSEI
jgi:hydroxymethylglutaryl-CoA reductase